MPLSPDEPPELLRAGRIMLGASLRDTQHDVRAVDEVASELLASQRQLPGLGNESHLERGHTARRPPAEVTVPFQPKVLGFFAGGLRLGTLTRTPVTDSRRPPEQRSHRDNHR